MVIKMNTMMMTPQSNTVVIPIEFIGLVGAYQTAGNPMTINLHANTQPGDRVIIIAGSSGSAGGGNPRFGTTGSFMTITAFSHGGYSASVAMNSGQYTDGPLTALIPARASGLDYVAVAITLRGVVNAVPSAYEGNLVGDGITTLEPWALPQAVPGSIFLFAGYVDTSATLPDPPDQDLEWSTTQTYSSFVNLGRITDASRPSGAIAIAYGFAVGDMPGSSAVFTAEPSGPGQAMAAVAAVFDRV